MSPYSMRNFRQSVLAGGTPVTNVLLVALLGLGVFSWIVPAFENWLDRYIWCTAAPPLWFLHPWTLVTGSLLTLGPIGLLFAALTLWFAGSSLERSLGTRTFAGLWCGLSAVTGLSLYLGALLIHPGEVIILNTWAVLGGVVVVWGLMNRRMQFSYFGIIPLNGLILAWVSVVFTLFLYPGLMSIFGLGGCAAGWAFVESRARRRRYQGVTRIPARRGAAAVGENAGGPLGTYRAWRQNRRIQKLLRNSGVDDRDYLEQR